MKTIRFNDPEFASQIQEIVDVSSLFDQTIHGKTRAIVDAVEANGDAALVEFTERFDGALVTTDQLEVTTAEFMAASVSTTPELRSAVALAAKNIETFCRQAVRTNWTIRNAQGGKVGEKFDPFHTVGIYIPGGTAPLVSTALMTILLAKAAGCPEIVVCTPCNSKRAIHPGLLYAIRKAGATRVFRVGGAQAIAAMAFGTRTIPRVQKIFGPGNAYVVAAKRMLFGHAAIDLLPGPSEVLILADDTADPRFVAADLLAQAEHGSGHERVWLVTPSQKLIKAVEVEIVAQLPGLARQEFIRKALDANGRFILVKSVQAGVAVVNQLAPEHCEIMARDAAKLAEKVTTAGAIFLGNYSPTVLGDYMAGPSHTLPTGGGGHSFAGLTVDQFQRRTSVVSYDRVALGKSLPALLTFSGAEGLDAHGQSASVRFREAPPKPRAQAAVKVAAKAKSRPAARTAPKAKK